MKIIKNSAIVICFISFVFLFFITKNTFANTPKTSDKITVEELLKNHLASIGTDKARNAVKSMFIVGTSKAVFGTGKSTGIKGISVLASQAEKNMVAMKFEDPSYRLEIAAYDGNDFSVGYPSPGVRSELGLFLFANEQTFENGILGGTLSTSWELLNFTEKSGKLFYDKTRTIDGVELYQLTYVPKNNPDLKIALFFETNTFRHVRTEYSRIIAATMAANIDSSASRRETRYSLIEQFSDFKPENNLTLPHTYDLEFKVYTGNSAEYKWSMNLNEFTFNSELGVNQFQAKNYQ